MPGKTPADEFEFAWEKNAKNTLGDQSKESLERLMESLKRVALGELSQEQIDAANSLRNELDKFALIGKATNLLCGRIEEYVDWASRTSSANSSPAKQALAPESAAKEERQQDLTSEDDEEEDKEYARLHYRVGPSKNERLNALGEIQRRKWTGAPLSELAAQGVGIMVRGRPILRMPESAKGHPTFLSWWFAVGKLNPDTPSGWSTLSGPWATRGHVEVISEQEWASLDPQDRERLTGWIDNLPIGMFYD